MRILNEAQIQEAIAYWKPLIGVSDWRIDIKMVTQADLPGKAAAVSWTLTKRWATITFTRPETFASDVIQEDMEISVVHELLHVADAAMLDKLCGNLSQVEDDIITEQGVDKLSNTLVMLRKASSRPFSWELQPSP